VNGRKAKAVRRGRRERNEQLLAAAYRQEARHIDTIDTTELWQRGRFTFLLPVCPDGIPEELQRAVQAHRTATLEGACPLCSLTLLVSDRGEVRDRHEPDCPAHPDRLVELGERLGVEVNRRA
jgi:hypothetical protein